MSENTKPMPHGALPHDWTHFAKVLGLGEDLLPVVSNLSAIISPRSTIKALGKVPSMYNKEGHAMGIGGWTEKRATPFEIARWSGVADYGICLQTRRVRAIDIDVPDAALAQEIEDVIVGMLGLGALPKRHRSNSGKRLLLVRCDDDSVMGKKVLKLPDDAGIIELLGDGQQCIVVGTHDSGVRYEWISGGVEGALPNAVPLLSREELDKVWGRLSDVFTDGKGGSSLVMGGAGRAGRLAVVSVVASDDVSDALEVLGLARGVGREGQVYIECPWVGEHSTKGVGESETGTAYFPAGGRGYERGHFKCLHAHCAGRSDMQFKVALGLEEEGGGFDVVPMPLGGGVGAGVAARVGGLEFPLVTNEDGTKVLATVSNLQSVLMSPESCGQYIKYDTFRDEIVWKRFAAGEVAQVGGWLPLKDTDYTRLRVELERTGFAPIQGAMMRDVVRRVSELNMFDTAIEWIESLPAWDGVPRAKRFMVDYMGAQESEYNIAVGEYMWTALAGRVLEPGCKADAAPIFVGEQYVGKSYAVASMVPDARMSTEIRLDDNEDNLSRKMRGKLIAEFAELRGLHTKELEGIKAFVSRQYEEWVPKYMEFATVYPRRLLFIGTSNKDELFSDETGNRRWFPVKVTRGDCEAIKRDRSQLWAEGVFMFRKEGVQRYYEKANCLAKNTRDEFMIGDVWEEKINQYLHEEDADGVVNLTRDFLRTGNILQVALGIDIRHMKKLDEMRVGKILRKFGYNQVRKCINGQQTRVWVKNEAD
jgi:predicted P-loop ATPase